jgi:hypothetical protein
MKKIETKDYINYALSFAGIAELNASAGWKVRWGIGYNRQENCHMELDIKDGHSRVYSKVEYYIRNLEDCFYYGSEVRDEVTKACAKDFKIMLGIK